MSLIINPLRKVLLLRMQPYGFTNNIFTIRILEWLIKSCSPCADLLTGYEGEFVSEDTLLTTLEDVGNLGDIDMDLLNNVEFNTSVDTQQHSTEFLSQSSELPVVDICVGGFSPVPPTTPQLVSGSPVSPQVIKTAVTNLWTELIEIMRIRWGAVL